MKSNYRFRKTMRTIDRFLSDLGDRVEECMDKITDSEAFDKATSTVDDVAADITKFTKRLINKIIE